MKVNGQGHCCLMWATKDEKNKSEKRKSDDRHNVKVTMTGKIMSTVPQECFFVRFVINLHFDLKVNHHGIGKILKDTGQCNLT